MEVPQQLLDAAYEHLGYAEGDLLDATDSPSGLTSEDWINKGEWLALANGVGAEKVFFVDNNPVIVFATADSNKQQEKFRQIWNMARPPLVFIASPGELAVYNLNHGPARDQKDWEDTLEKRRLETAETIAEVSEKLQQFKREQIETGRLFEDERFGEDNRADKALISNLQTVRNKLLKSGLDEAKYAHSLIGRSIFIRYLEDREILKESYFKKITRGKAEWRKILDEPLSDSFVDPELAKRFYFRVLRNKDFTYALFKQLSKDFNGDMFPDIEEEQANVRPAHLRILRDFLCGNAEGQQLFFFAYKFNIIPIELISSIYEEFYNTGKSKDSNNGTHYTPPAIVEFLLGQVLTPECLDEKPRILDPACGSGIFLVESFRRIVRHRVCSQKGRRLNDAQLRKILRDQISGIDINGEAIRVAAFSLYLAFLHYQNPPDILEQIKQGKKLPNLKHERRRIRKPEQHYDILIEANSFDVEAKVADDDVLSKFTQSCADIVVGNPPWGSPGNKEEEKESRDAMDTAVQWCDKQEPKLSIGDREWSQAFIHIVINLMRDGGRAALLVSSGVLFKNHDKSQGFRKQWLTTTTLQSVVNFAHVRDIFFKGKARQSGAQSPFIAVCFTKQKPDYEASFRYWSAKKTAIVKGTQSVILGVPDLKRLRQNDVISDDNLWKIYWWGSHRDESLIRVLGRLPRLDTLEIKGQSITAADFGRGFEKTGDPNPPGELLKYSELPTRYFKKYGLIDKNNYDTVPDTVHRKGAICLYEGTRLLVKRGITERMTPKGQIIARLACEPFCFRNSIHGVRLPNATTWEGKILVGIFWSSLTRYYYWLTAGSWGMWHNEIHLEDIQRMPIQFPIDIKLRGRIVEIVEELQKKGANSSNPDIFDDTTLTFEQTVKLEHDLDEAIFDLYELNEAEQDLIREMCEYGLDLFYNNVDSEAVKLLEVDRPANNCGLSKDIPTRRDRQKGFEGYIRTFLRIWNRELEPDGEFRWQLIRPNRNIPMVAMVFSTQDKKRPLGPVKGSETEQWHRVLEKLDETLLAPVSKRVYIEGVVRTVSDTDIMIIKRNERRLWTRSMAREDAEATLLQAMNMQSDDGGR